MVAQAMALGIQRTGETAQIHESTVPGVIAEIAVFYGFDPNLRERFAEYRAAGRTVVFVDLGYWGRKEGGARAGYHKVTVNGRHPTGYFQDRPHDASRFAHFGLKVQPWRKGKGASIIVAGMSAKSAAVEGYGPEQWERQAIATLRQHSKRPIIYRPKPSWRDAQPIAGVLYGIGGLESLLADCHAVVTHHSNVGVDALLAGVPVFSVEGVASCMGSSDLAEIEAPRRDGDREQFMADLAWCQWTPAEMRQGLLWRHLKREGLV